MQTSSVPYSEDERLRLERAWLAEKMSDPLWAAYTSTHRLYAAVGRSYVLWTVHNGRPAVVEIFTCVGFSLHSEKGMQITFKSHYDPMQHLAIGPTPLKVHDVFVWTPAFCDVRYVPITFTKADSPKRLTVPFCIKMAHRTDKPMHEGCTYMLDLVTFKHQFPDVL